MSNSRPPLSFCESCGILSLLPNDTSRKSKRKTRAHWSFVHSASNSVTTFKQPLFSLGSRKSRIPVSESFKLLSGGKTLKVEPIFLDGAPRTLQVLTAPQCFADCLETTARRTCTFPLKHHKSALASRRGEIRSRSPICFQERKKLEGRVASLNRQDRRTSIADLG